jgi:hypothetical protein
VRFALTSGFIDDGFSGSPAFRPNGTLVGVMVESSESVVECPHASPLRFLVPYMASIAGSSKIIQSHLSGDDR